MTDFLKVYVIIVNFNCWADTIECLESVFRSDYSDFHVLVIDNNSPDNSMEYIKKWAKGELDVWVEKEAPLRSLSFPPVTKPIPFTFFNLKKAEIYKENLLGKLTLVQTGENLGFAAGINAGLKLIVKSDSEGFVYLLNPDVVIEKDTIGNLVNCATDRNAVYGTSIFDYFSPENLLLMGGARIMPYGTIRFIKKKSDLKNLDYISGASFFTTLSNFKKVGFLPEEYFLYWEETDWCFKAKKQGIKMKLCESAKCYDKGGKSVGRGNYLSEYYYTLNSLKFHRKYFPQRIKLIKIFSVFRILKRVFYGKFSLCKAIVSAIRDFENRDKK